MGDENNPLTPIAHGFLPHLRMADLLQRAANRNLYPTSDGTVVGSLKEQIDSNLNFESRQGQWVSGGNCGQNSENLR